MSNGSSNWPNSRLLIRLDSWQWAVLDEMAYSEDYVDERGLDTLTGCIPIWGRWAMHSPELDLICEMVFLPA